MDFLIRLIGVLIISVGIIILIIGFLSNQKIVKRFGVILIAIPTALFLLSVLYFGILDLIIISPEKNDFYGSYILDEKSYNYVKNRGFNDTLSKIAIYENDSVFIEPTDYLNTSGLGVFEYETWRDNKKVTIVFKVLVYDIIFNHKTTIV